MFDIGFQELIVIFLVALFVLGPEKLPEVARTLGKMVAHLKSSMGDFKAEMDREVNAAKFSVTEHQVPSLKGEPVTLRTEHEKDEAALTESAPAEGASPGEPLRKGADAPARPPIDGEPAPVEGTSPGEPSKKGAVAPARPQTAAWPAATSVQPEPPSGRHEPEPEQNEPESEKQGTEGKA